MASRLQDIKFGTVDITDLAAWINERHNIYLKKEAGEPKPWTTDKIMQQYKFTNAFRQLDKGTVALRNMLKGKNATHSLIFFNICWYRLFNWYEHATELGFVYDFTDLERYINLRHSKGKKIFTGAHMTTGVAFESKHISYLRAAREAWDRRIEFANFIHENQSMEAVFEKLLELYMVGRFIAYELVCDLRFTLLENAPDKCTWANLGPGAQRGLKRLGLPYETQEQGLTSMRLIYERLLGQLLNEPAILSKEVMNASVPFELREVEHSLCEFDKYCRVQFGEGRPRAKYAGI